MASQSNNNSGNKSGMNASSRSGSSVSRSNSRGNNTSKRGFAAMSPERQREIASMGGKAAHAKGTAHQFTSEEAREAGRKGGVAVSRDRAHMAAIGRKGGASSRLSSSRTIGDSARN